MRDPASSPTFHGDELATLVSEVKSCRLCAAELPLEPRPLLRAGAGARLLIISQAPGLRAHETGLSFNDRSGDRLREWLGVDRHTFYDESKVALMAMGFCYPGTDEKGGDLPPSRRCAPHWHARVRALLPDIALTLLVGASAQRIYLPETKGLSATEIVSNWRSFMPRTLPLPHPSWRNTGWLRRHPWFGEEVLPELRRRVADIL
jgi:uracil-DNA glycosylase